MRDKTLVTLFALSNAVDIILTLCFLSRGLGTEFNPLARQMMVHGNAADLLVVKVAYTATLIGTYALAARINSRLRYPTEKSLQIATVLMWSVQVWNFVNLVAAVAA